MKKKLFFIMILTLVVSVLNAQFDEFYPTVIELKQINGAEKERARLCQTQKKYDRQPTGFYVEAGKAVKVNVEILTAAVGDVMPQIWVGTMGFNVDGRNTGTATTLMSGLNTITNHSGGLIWLSYVTNNSAEPTGVAKITFTEESEHVRAPRYVFEYEKRTTALQFKEMMDTYNTVPDILYQSDTIVVVSTREAALTHTYPSTVNKVEWMNSIHTLIRLEDQISGMDNNDPNPVHHRLNAGEVRFLLVQNTSSSPHANSAGYTGYPNGSVHRYLTKLGTSTNNSWMLGHELGHQHQQGAYLINKATESTVNIYSYVVERNIQGAGYNRTAKARWDAARSTYLQLPFSERIYDITDDNLEAIVGFNRDELRFMVWEQLFLIFGDEFYKNLHRVVREEKKSSGSSVADERRSYLIWKASQVSGYDLTEFFNIWGIRVTDATIKSNLRAKMAYAKSQGDILDLSAIGRSPEELVTITGQDRPSWSPIKLRGITHGEAPAAAIDRTNWSVVTSHAGPADATVGGDDPKNIIDNSETTAFAFVKPGVTYNNIHTPSSDSIWFTIDMKTQTTFNYLQYTHRFTGNTYAQLRARQFSIYGSNDGENFTSIVAHYVVDYSVNANVLIIEFPQVSYRYVKIVYEDWDKNNGSTVQVADVKVGIKTQEIYPTPDPLKFKVNVTADDGIICSQTGVNLADEDSDYSISFTLAEGKKSATATVDGKPATLTVNDGVYTLTVKVSNHLNVRFVSSTSGLGNMSSGSFIGVYPNPVKAGHPVTLKNIKNATSSELEARVFSVSGVEILKSNISKENPQLTIPQKGVYFIEVKSNDKQFKSKVIVE